MTNKVLFFIELPPPVHGMTYINKIIYDELKDKENYTFYNVKFSKKLSEIGKINFTKILKNLIIILKAWIILLKINPQKIYSVISATKLGIIRDFILLLPCIIFKKKLIIHLHGFTYYDIYANNKLYRKIFDILASNAKIIVLCEIQKIYTKKILKKESYVLYNTIKSDIEIKPRKLMHDKIKLLYLSNISRSKGIFDLINSIKNINNVELIIAGDIISEKDFFNKACFENKEKVKYVGFADEKIKSELFKRCDIFCFPSKLREGSPVSIIEAMAHGLPVIATDQGCVKEMIKDCGYVISGEVNEETIRVAINEIINNYEKYSKIAIENYKKNYSKILFLNKLVEIIEEDS